MKYKILLSIFNMGNVKAVNQLAWSLEGNISLFLIRLWKTHCSPIFPYLPQCCRHLHLVGLSCPLMPVSSDGLIFQVTLQWPFYIFPVFLPIMQLASMITVECSIRKEGRKWCSLHLCTLKYWNCHSCSSPALTVSTCSHTTEYWPIAEFCII